MAIFAFTVGSLGDIISLIQLAKAVTKALCDSKGSSAEYFDLILEIDSVVHTVESVQHELSVRGPDKLAPPVENGLHHAVRICVDLLRRMNEKILAWMRGFSITSWIIGKDAWLRLGWGLFTREELVSLRRRLSGQIETMSILLMLAHGERLDRFSDKQDEHALEIRRKQDELALELRRIANGHINTTNMDPSDSLSMSDRPVRVSGLPRGESELSAKPCPDPVLGELFDLNTDESQRELWLSEVQRPHEKVSSSWESRVPTWSDVRYTPPPTEPTSRLTPRRDSWSAWPGESMPSQQRAELEVDESSWNVSPRQPRRDRKRSLRDYPTKEPNEADTWDEQLADDDKGGWRAPEPESWATRQPGPYIEWTPPSPPPSFLLEKTPVPVRPTWRNVPPIRPRRDRQQEPDGFSPRREPIYTPRVREPKRPTKPGFANRRPELS